MKRILDIVARSPHLVGKTAKSRSYTIALFVFTCWPAAMVLSAALFSACTSSQSPPRATSSLTALSIPDTINFGAVQLGTLRDTLVQFQNNGTDTIEITSQSISGSSFSFVDPSQRVFSLAPGAKKSVEIRFNPKDTLGNQGIDTVFSQGASRIIILSGAGIPFNSFFFKAPSLIVISLTGLISEDAGSSSGEHSFYFEAPLTSQGHDTLVFYSTSQSIDSGTYHVTEESWNNIVVVLDTAERRIDWLAAWSSDEQGDLYYHDYTSTVQGLDLRGLNLAHDSLGWLGTENGSSIGNSVYVAQNIDGGDDGLFPYVTDSIISIKGYNASASLRVSIK